MLPRESLSDFADRYGVNEIRTMVFINVEMIKRKCRYAVRD